MHGILDYIKDNEYKIILFNNKINIKNFNEINLMTDKEIRLKIDNKTYVFKGTSFTVKRLEEKEILIEGILNNIDIYE